MRPYLLPLFLFISFYNLFSQGVEFNSLSWEEALHQSKKENKLVFLDAYTDWCAPCKQMDKKVFSSRKVGDFYNENFINVKVNMEKGEGPSLRKRYDVILYPSLLFINSDGTLIHRVSGYKNVNEFLDEGRKAVDPNKNLLALERRYQNGDKEPEFLRNYLELLYQKGDGSHEEILSQYLNTQEDWSSEENIELINQMTESVDGPGFAYMIENAKLFEDRFGKVQFGRRIQGLVYTKIQTDKDMSLEEIDKLFKIAYPEEAAKKSSQYRMTYYRQKGDRQGYAEAALKHYNEYSTNDPGELSEVAWTFYKVIEDNELLKQACKLNKKSIKMEKAFYNTETHAALLYKMGKTSKANKLAKKAIELAKAEGANYESTEELFEKYN